jgi:excisionase family DNA binding protein
MAKVSIEKYPIIIQVIDTYLLAYSPDFDYKIAEKYEPQSPGQTELLIRRIRDHLVRLSRQKEVEGKEPPEPSLPITLATRIQADFLSSTEAARLLNISHDTLRRMALRSEITYFATPGGHRRFIRSEIESLRSKLHTAEIR